MDADRRPRLLGARILSEANDLKRTSEALADELELDRDHVARVIRGEAGVQAALALIARMGEVYPIDASELMIGEDDCVAGARIMRAAASRATSRVFDRRDRHGGRSPYYEYRDTAMSRLSPFRPEWIRELRVVRDADPNNPDVVFNKGHLLNQYTLFIGPVNYYWEVDGIRHGREMTTGDSVFGTPWWPHTFTARDASNEAYILAVTFAGEVRRAQKELYALGRKARGWLLSVRQPRRAFIELVRQHMANDDLTRDELEQRVRAHTPGLELRRVFDEDTELGWDEVVALASCLGVEAGDLFVPRYKSEDEVLIKRHAPHQAVMLPSEERRLYGIVRMARTTKMPFLRGSMVHVLGRSASLDDGFCSSLYTWLYNYSNVPSRIAWTDGLETRQDVLAPGDSACLLPFVRHAFWADEGEPTLCCIRVSGGVGLAAQRELSGLSDTERVFAETGRWFE